ncbi:MAG: ABC transporter ATP-binding protein [Erysipelotrichaceae bacterium]|nr:ABC transporter ATP-binding protein [Erysipelotrichaceae bacterium]
MNPENAIEIRDMSKSFKIQSDRAKSLKDMILFFNRKNSRTVLNVLNHIYVDIKKGETVALIGTNGSGKSTLLKLMTKIIYPTSGTVETNGKLTSLLELGAGFHQDFTGRENIYFNASIFGLTQEDIERRMDDIIEFSELGAFIDEPIRTYSSGMYMRLAFSIAINVDAEILLIDEILAVGDQHFQEKCYAKLRELKASDKTIVIVSHSLDVVKDLCTRAIWIYKGDFRMDGTPAEVIDEYLRQIAIDNQEQKRLQMEQGTGVYSGLINIDQPKNYLRVSENETVQLRGWRISDCQQTKFEIRAGDRLVENIVPEARQDVVDAFVEQYSGFLDVETTGFTADLDISQYKDQVADGRLNVTVGLYDENGIRIIERYLVLSVVERG